MAENREPPSRLEIAIAARQFELELFWKRALFFWGFIASAFVGFVATYPDRPLLAIGLSCFGMVCSLCWALVNRGSKFWYETWETKAKRVGKKKITRLFEDEEEVGGKWLWKGMRFSVSRITIALSDFTFLLWVGVLGFQVVTYFEWVQVTAKEKSVLVGFLLGFSVLYMGLVLCLAGGETKKLKKSK